MFFPILSAKQLLFSEYVFRLKFEENTKASISPIAYGSKIMLYVSDWHLSGFIESMHISAALFPTVFAEKLLSVLEEIVPMPLTGVVPLSESALMFPAMYVALSVQFSPLLLAISMCSETIFNDPETAVIFCCCAALIISCAISDNSVPEISASFLSKVFSTVENFVTEGKDFQKFFGLTSDVDCNALSIMLFSKHAVLAEPILFS